MFLQLSLRCEVFKISDKISCQICLKLSDECATGGYEAYLASSWAHASEKVGVGDVFDSGAILHIGLIGLLSDEFGGV